MPGNCELVARLATGQMQHWWRLNGAPWTWACSTNFGANVRDAGSSMVQTRGVKNGQLELVCALNSGAMQRYARNDDAGFVWSAKEIFGANTIGAPMMIEGQFGATDENTSGNLELCVAVAGGKVEHWWCTTARAWQRSATFGANVAGVVSLIEGSYGFDLEMVVKRTDGRLQHYWRDGAGWHAGAIL